MCKETSPTQETTLPLKQGSFAESSDISSFTTLPKHTTGTDIHRVNKLSAIYTNSSSKKYRQRLRYKTDHVQNIIVMSCLLHSMYCMLCKISVKFQKLNIWFCIHVSYEFTLCKNHSTVKQLKAVSITKSSFYTHVKSHV